MFHDLVRSGYSLNQPPKSFLQHRAKFRRSAERPGGWAHIERLWTPPRKSHKWPMEVWRTNPHAPLRILETIVHPEELDGLGANDFMNTVTQSDGYIGRTLRRNGIGRDLLVFRPDLAQANARWATSPSLDPFTQLSRHAQHSVRPIGDSQNVPWAFRPKHSTLPQGIHELALDAYMSLLGAEGQRLLLSNEMHGHVLGDSSFMVIDRLPTARHEELMLLRFCGLPQADIPPESDHLIPRHRDAPNGGSYSSKDRLHPESAYISMSAYLLEQNPGIDFASVACEPVTVWKSFREGGRGEGMSASKAGAVARVVVEPLVDLLLQAAPNVKRRYEAEAFTGDLGYDMRLEVGADIGASLQTMWNVADAESTRWLTADEARTIVNYLPVYYARLGGPVAAAIEPDNPLLAVAIREEIDDIVRRTVQAVENLEVTRPGHRALGHGYLEMYGLEELLRARNMEIEEFDPTFDTPDLTMELFASSPRDAFVRQINMHPTMPA
jgi:hypothetical protein